MRKLLLAATLLSPIAARAAYVPPPASPGTATTVLHGNAAGAPSYGPVNLSTDVTGTLPQSAGGTGIAGSPFGTAAGTFAQGNAVRQLNTASDYFVCASGNTACGGTIGSNSNTCLSWAQACLTVKYAASLALATDFGGPSGAQQGNATIELSGLSNESAFIGGVPTGAINQSGQLYGGQLRIYGADSTAAISPSGSGCSTGYGDAITLDGGIPLSLGGTITLATACSGRSALFEENGAHAGLMAGATVTFGNSAIEMVHLEEDALFQSDPGTTIVVDGNALSFINAMVGSNALLNGTISCTGTPAFSFAFVRANFNATVALPTSFSGCSGVTGPAYDIRMHSIIMGFGGTSLTEAIPGNAPGNIYWSGTINTTNPSNNPAIDTNATILVPNDSTTGTGQYAVAKLTAAGNAIDTTSSDTDGAVGIAWSNAGTTGLATIVTSGIMECLFENATTAGDYVGYGTGTAGHCRDVGTTRPTHGLGRVLSTQSGAGTYSMMLNIW